MNGPVKLPPLTVKGEAYRWLCTEASGLRSTGRDATLRAKRLLAWFRSDRTAEPDKWDIHWLRTIASERGTLRSAWAAMLLQEFPRRAA